MKGLVSERVTKRDCIVSSLFHDHSSLIWCSLSKEILELFFLCFQILYALIITSEKFCTFIPLAKKPVLKSRQCSPSYFMFLNVVSKVLHRF